MALSLQFNVHLHAEAAKVNWKTVLFARHICRLFQLIFDSDHNFYEHRAGFYMSIYIELQKRIHVVE